MKQRKFLIDRNMMSCLIYVLSLCLSVYIVSGVSGSDSMFYAAGPIIAAAALVFVSQVPGSSFIARQIAYRLGRDRMTDALLFVHGAVLVQLIVGGLIALATLFFGETIGSWLFGSRYDSLVMYMLLPGVILGLISGPLKGALDGAGAGILARISLYLGAAGTLISTIILSGTGRSRGILIAKLLRNDIYGSVYAGAGAGLGFSCGCLVTTIVLVFGMILLRHYYRQQEAGLEIREEKLGGVMAYYARNLLVPFLITLLVAGSLLADYRLGLHLYGSHDKTGFGLHWWDGFSGVALPTILGTCCLQMIFISRLPFLCARDFERRNHKYLRLRYAMMQRLCGYLTISTSAFVFGAAKPIVQIVHHGLNAQARESAILTMKLSSINIFLISASVLVMVFFWQCGYERLVAASLAIAFGFQLIFLLLFMHVLTISVEAIPLSMAVFYLAFLLTVTLVGWGNLLHATDLSFLFDDLLVLVSSAVAAIPVCLLNDFITDEIVPVGGIILLLIIFLVVFIPFSILLGAVDLAAISHIPGGRYISVLAALISHQQNG